MQKCSSDPTNPVNDNCDCPEGLMQTSSVNSSGKIGNFCQDNSLLPPPNCDYTTGAPCICPVGKTVTKGPGMNGYDIYYCK